MKQFVLQCYKARCHWEQWALSSSTENNLDNSGPRGWRGGSAAKSLGWSSWGHRFNSQHPHEGSPRAPSSLCLWLFRSSLVLRRLHRDCRHILHPVCFKAHQEHDLVCTPQSALLVRLLRAMAHCLSYSSRSFCSSVPGSKWSHAYIGSTDSALSELPNKAIKQHLIIRLFTL